VFCYVRQLIGEKEEVFVFLMKYLYQNFVSVLKLYLRLCPVSERNVKIYFGLVHNAVEFESREISHVVD